MHRSESRPRRGPENVRACVVSLLLSGMLALASCSTERNAVAGDTSATTGSPAVVTQQAGEMITLLQRLRSGERAEDLASDLDRDSDRRGRCLAHSYR